MGKIFNGLSEINSIRLGSTSVSKVMIGLTQVFPPPTTTTTTTVAPTTTTTTVACVAYLLSGIRRSTTSCALACTGSLSTTYGNTSNFATSTKLYSDNSCTTKASGYYSNGSICRYWDGSTLGSASACPTTTTTTLTPVTVNWSMAPTTSGSTPWTMEIYRNGGQVVNINSTTSTQNGSFTAYQGDVLYVYLSWNCTVSQGHGYGISSSGCTPVSGGDGCPNTNVTSPNFTVCNTNTVTISCT